MLPDIPRAPLPPQVADALYGPSPAREAEMLPPMFNPWTPRAPGDGRLDYVSDDAEERALESSVQHVAALFTPKAAKGTPNLDSPFYPVVDQDDDQKDFYAALAPVQKLFAPSFASTSPSQQLNKATETTKTRRDADGFVWSQRFDSVGELIDEKIVFDESEN